MTGNGLCIFGEVLYDVFPDGTQVLGGAPFNVAWHAQAFGLSPQFISRVGSDEAGDRVIAAMQRTLEGKGYDVGGADGLPGYKTRRSIGDWQAKNGLAPTCFPDRGLVDKVR